MKLILGSSSWSRKAVMDDLGLEFDVYSPDIDEKAIRDEDPVKLVELVGMGKLDKCCEKFEGEEVMIICGDQVCDFEGRIMEKPVDEAEAREFLRSYSGKSMFKVNSVCVADLRTGLRKCVVTKCEIVFKTYGEDVIDELMTDELLMNASGAVSVNGGFDHLYIEKLKGDMSEFYGLPKKVLLKLLSDIEKFNK